MTIKADFVGRFCQQDPFITGMNRVTAGALLIQIGFVDTVFSCGCHWLLVTVKTEGVGRSTCGNFCATDLMTGVAFSLLHWLV